MNGKGDDFRESVRQAYDKAGYWCQDKEHIKYGKPKGSCEQCTRTDTPTKP